MSEDKYGAIFIISFFYHYSTILGNFYYLRTVGVCIYIHMSCENPIF